MRLFTAIYPPAEVVEEVRERVPAGFKTQAPDRWHVTLAFHPDVSASRVETLEQRLSEAVPAHAPFTVRLSGSGTFGSVSWIGVEGDLDSLHRLARTARRAATGAHISADRRAYHPHMTVARDDGALALALSGFESSPWLVAEVRLIDSHLGPRPSHEVLSLFSLGEP